MAFFGEKNEQGAMVADVTQCLLTGRDIVPGDLFFKVPGTRFFYRVSADAQHLHDERQAAIMELFQQEHPDALSAAPVEAAAAPEEKPVRKTRGGGDAPPSEGQEV